MRFPIQDITGTAIEFPIALYLGLSGVLVRTSVQPSGNPCKRAASRGVSFRILFVVVKCLTGLCPPPLLPDKILGDIPS